MNRMYYMSKTMLFDFRRLSFCKVTGDGCVALASALRSDHCSLKELDLSFNHLSDQGVEMLTEIQRDPRCSLEKLKYAQTGCITNALLAQFQDIILRNALARFDSFVYVIHI